MSAARVARAERGQRADGHQSATRGRHAVFELGLAGEDLVDLATAPRSRLPEDVLRQDAAPALLGDREVDPGRDQAAAASELEGFLVLAGRELDRAASGFGDQEKAVVLGRRLQLRSVALRFRKARGREIWVAVAVRCPAIEKRQEREVLGVFLVG